MAKTAVDIKRTVKQLVLLLEPEIRVNKVILFGSHARGTANEWSDIDIAVISNDFKKMKPIERIEFLALRRKGCDPALSPLPYTVDAYENASHLDFLGEIKRTGRVVFEAE
ncbi:MAG: nucleotidyltransferase domain-containing protein [Dehalococcoidia bacterium]|nr:nucleotidyltransferase domain-containing protein [Dehalococcoidia bacterium]